MLVAFGLGLIVARIPISVDIGVVRDAEGRTRVRARAGMGGVRQCVALDEIIPLASTSIHLHHRLQRMLEALIRRAPAERGALEHPLAMMPS